MGSYYCSSSQSCATGQTGYYRQNGCCSISSADECGLPATNRFGRILNGRDAMRKQWPWMVLIRYKIRISDKQKLCGGTLISRNWVLTAAHCVSPVENVYENCPECLKIYAGIHDYTLPFAYEPHRLLLKVERLVIHADYKMEGNWNDIALVEVDDVDMNISDYVKPICLPRSESPTVGSSCFISGWGMAENGMPGTLQEGTVKVADVRECKRTYDDLPTVSKVRIEDHICGGEHLSELKNMTDTCQGDSGGPLMCQRCTSCNWYIAGIVSFGLPQCGKTFGVYTSVAKYEDWILSVAKQTKVRPPQIHSCENCCTYLRLSGGSLQTSRHGIYMLEPNKFDTRAVYKQQHADVASYIWFLRGKYNIWFVNRNVGVDKNGGILSSEATPCPTDATKWRVYNQTEAKWKVSHIQLTCINATDLLWSEWSSWNECTPENNTKIRTRACPYNDICDGDAIETILCPNAAEIETHCCKQVLIKNSVKGMDGTYVATRLIDDAPVFLCNETGLSIYFVSSYQLWVINDNINSINAKAYADGANTNEMCPDEFEQWKVHGSNGWADSEIVVECTTESREWTACDCDLRVETDMKNNATRRCTNFERDCSTRAMWGEWTRCLGGRFECDFPREQKRFRNCFPFCEGDIEQVEKKECVSDTCSTCCPELISVVPSGILHDDRRLIYRMLPSVGNINVPPAYQGHDVDGTAKDKYIALAYGKYWIHSDKPFQHTGTTVAMYKISSDDCPDVEKSDWQYFSSSSGWITSSDIDLYCSIEMN